MSTLPNLKSLPFGGAGPIRDKLQLETIANLKLDYNQILQDDSISYEFLERYYNWIRSTKLNTIKGIELFTFKCYSNGTTEAFDKFYLKHNRRRLRMFKGEYMYHILTARNCFPNFAYLDDDRIEKYDAVVISLPFADTGNVHHNLNFVLDMCSQLNVPVLIDCAFFGICQNIDFEFTWPCIEQITFSLSKSFPISHARIGMRLTRTDDDDPLFVMNKSNYTNRIGAAIGIELLKQYDADYIVSKYKEHQLNYCEELKATPSSTVIFGLGGEEYHQYDRGAGNHRLSFYRYLGDLFD